MSETERIAKRRNAWFSVALAIALLPLAAASPADAYHHHRRTSIYGGHPAYWGVERGALSYRDIRGLRRARLEPADASIRQLDPSLRGPGDGRLLERLGPSRPPEEVEILPYWSFSPQFNPIPWRGYWRWHGSLRNNRLTIRRHR